MQMCASWFCAPGFEKIDFWTIGDKRNETMRHVTNRNATNIDTNVTTNTNANLRNKTTQTHGHLASDPPHSHDVWRILERLRSQDRFAAVALPRGGWGR